MKRKNILLLLFLLIIKEIEIMKSRTLAVVIKDGTHNIYAEYLKKLVIDNLPPEENIAIGVQEEAIFVDNKVQLGSGQKLLFLGDVNYAEKNLWPLADILYNKHEIKIGKCGNNLMLKISDIYTHQQYSDKFINDLITTVRQKITGKTDYSLLTLFSQKEFEKERCVREKVCYHLYKFAIETLYSKYLIDFMNK